MWTTNDDGNIIIVQTARWWCTHHPAGRYVFPPLFQQALVDLDDKSSTTTCTGQRTTTATTTTRTARTPTPSTLTRTLDVRAEHDVVNIGSSPTARPSGDGNGLHGLLLVSRIIADVRATSVDVCTTFAMLNHCGPARFSPYPAPTHTRYGLIRGLRAHDQHANTTSRLLGARQMTWPIHVATTQHASRAAVL